MEKETFEVSSAEGYWPENVTAQDKINYKTYVRWDIPEDVPEGLTYEVYRSTLKNFVPGETTLVAEDVTDGYWCDINTNYSISLYYKVRAVVKDKEGNVVSASSYSDTAESTPIDRNEYKKALGHKEYWLMQILQRQPETAISRRARGTSSMNRPMRKSPMNSWT